MLSNILLLLYGMMTCLFVSFWLIINSTIKFDIFIRDWQPKLTNPFIKIEEK